MQLIARTLQYLANRYLADPARSNQNTSRANAAEASDILRKRRIELDDVDAFLQARRLSQPVAETQTSMGGQGVEHAG